MLDDAGVPLSDAALLRRVFATGAAVARRGTSEDVEFGAWRRELRRAAKVGGRRISVHRVGEDTVVVSDPDFVVTQEQLRATVEAIPVPPLAAPRIGPPRRAVRRAPASTGRVPDRSSEEYRNGAAAGAKAADAHPPTDDVLAAVVRVLNTARPDRQATGGEHDH